MTLCEEFKINDNPILVPDTGVTVKKTDIQASDSGRDESGVMHRFLTRSKVKTWTFYYSSLTGEELEYIEGLISGQPDFSFSYTNPDGSTGQCKAYVQDINYGIRNIRTGKYFGCSFSVIEC